MLFCFMKMQCRIPNLFDITKLGNINLIREKMKEDGDYYFSEEEFRKLKKEVEHAKAEVEFLKKLLPSEVNGGSRCFNIKGFSLKRPLRAKQPF